MATQKRQQRQPRQQQKMNAGGFLKNLHLKWWIWIIIIIIGVNIIGSVLAPLLSTLGTFGKAMKNILGVPEQILSYANDHPWMYYVAFFAVAGSQLGLFGAAKTYIGKKMFREKAEGKSTEQTLSKTKEAVKEKIKQKEEENKKLEDEGKTPLSQKDIADSVSKDVVIEQLKKDIENLKEQVEQVQKGQATQAKVAAKVESQEELVEESKDIPEEEKGKANKELDNMKDVLDGGAA